MSIISRLFGRNQDETRVCTMCGQEKVADDFYIKDKRTGRRYSWCKDCHNWRMGENYQRKTADAREAKRNAPKPTTKQCTCCDEVKPLDAFELRGDDHSRLRSHCRDCRRRQKQEYSALHREDIHANDVRYRQENRTFILARQHQWRLDNPDRWREMMSASRQRNAEQRRAYNRRYAREHAAQLNVYWHARRARKLANGGSHTVKEWEQCKAYFDYHCLMCGRREPEIKLTKDHVIPIELGGPDDIANIQPLCQRCNSSKQDTILDLRPDWE